mmetsp:Transcript_11039/g.16768  ORF Transcript_11039/g.16768 Transcript_11039/m.16768 type:complete len:227 (+) Transcript_11039:582-1262(+)
MQYHKKGEWPLVYAHYEEQKIVTLQPNIGAVACKWRIGADFKYKYLKLQDIILKVNALSNAKIYITSFFRSDKEASAYFVDAANIDSLGGTGELVIEMCNTTELYVVPLDPSQEHTADFSFWVFQAQEYEYGSKYNIISKLISGVGGLILIITVVFMLDGFSTLYHAIQERKQAQNEDSGEKKKPSGKTSNAALNYQQNSDDGLSKNPAVHEGGGQESKAGSRETN